ncbi:MAG: porin [Elusimicrobiaceae bacterium]|uniref:porin n=1 Tax=Candidatus Avelusimicrobium faecicola TaxID=3416205 RepID=UPI002A79C95B|nr:porin [Spirochaetota bacterium]MDY2940475.1 porin [Elusimicrobiaceae bacterium]
MKKLLGLLVAALVAMPASADVLNNVELKGEVQTIASDVRTGYNSGTNFRVLAGLSADLVEDVRANVLFQYNDAWLSNFTGNTVQKYWDDVTLAEANVVLSNLFDCFEATVGRQFYGDEDSAVMYVGPNHYVFNMNRAPSLDAAKLTYSDDFKSVTLIAGKLVFSPGTTSEINNTIYGADVRLNLTDTLKLQVYGYDVKAGEDSRVLYDEKHSGFYGAKATFAPEAFALSAEYARAFLGHRLVKEPKDTPYLVKVDASLNLAAFTPRATFYYAKGGFGTGNYYPSLLIGHLLSGYGEPLSNYSNDGLRLFNVGVDYTYEKWVLSLDGYSFQDRTAQEAGTLEADLNVKYNHNEYVQLFAGVGYGKYGGFLKDAAKDNTIGQLGMLIKF